MIVITGATGNTGSVAAEKLLAAGEKVRVVGRSAERLDRFAAKGAELFVGDVTNGDAMIRAFTGASAVYAMMPPVFAHPDPRGYQEQVSNELSAAVEKSGVKHVVALSSIGAEQAEGTGPIVGAHWLEQKLNRIAGLNVLHLRPGYFMENLFLYIGLIQKTGMVAGTARGDVPIPWIATRDIGEVAAEALRRRTWTGSRVRELLGPRDVNMDEVARILGQAVGKRIPYTQLPAFVVKPAMVSMGISAAGADLILELDQATNAGRIKALAPRSEESATPTTLEQFVVEVFLPAYQGKRS